MALDEYAADASHRIPLLTLPAKYLCARPQQELPSYSVWQGSHDSYDSFRLPDTSLGDGT